MKIYFSIEDDSEEWRMFSKMKKELGVDSNRAALQKIIAIAAWKWDAKSNE